MAKVIDKGAQGEQKAAKKDEKEKRVRLPYPGLQCDASGKPTVKLKEWPADYDRKVHQNLKRSDFENDAPWLIKRAERLERAAARLRKEAEISTKYGGNAKIRKEAKKLANVAGQLKELFGSMLAQGIPEEKIREMLGGFDPNTLTGGDSK